MVQNTNFNTYEGSLYKDGVLGLKTLVLGASYPCKDLSCKVREQCNKCKLDYRNEFCRSWPSEKILLCDCVKYEISEYREYPKVDSSYYKFMDPFSQFINSKGCSYDQEDIWERIAFMEYIQHVVINKNYISQGEVRETDFGMFLYELNRLTPDFIIVWGAPVRDNIIGNICDYYEVQNIENKELIKISSDSYHCYIAFIDHPSKPGGPDMKYACSLFDEMLDVKNNSK